MSAKCDTASEGHRVAGSRELGKKKWSWSVIKYWKSREWERALEGSDEMLETNLKNIKDSV